MNSQKNRLGLSLIMLALLLACSGTIASPSQVSSSAASSPPELPEGARLVFEDGFERDDLGSYAAGTLDKNGRTNLDWTTLKGKWSIRADKNNDNRYLWGVGGPGELVLLQLLPENFRMEYQTWSDNPGDRSAFVCVPLANSKYKTFYRYHFAANYSRNNVLTCLDVRLTDRLSSPLPRPGQRCNVIIQKSGDLLEMYVDGERVFSVKHKQYNSIQYSLREGIFVGLYTWSEGVCYDNVKVYALPSPQYLMISPHDKKISRDFWQDFSEDDLNTRPKTAISWSGPEEGVVIIDEPTVKYYPLPTGQKLIEDKCARLRSTSAGLPDATAMTIPFDHVSEGEVELEILARSNDGVKISLLDNKGGESASLIIDEKGGFWAKNNCGSLIKMRDSISYPNRPINAPFYLQPYRWFTFRFTFDCEQRLWQLSVVNLYHSSYCSSKYRGMDYLSLSEGLPLLTDNLVGGIHVQVSGASELLVDNVCMISPLAKSINGISRKKPLPEILGQEYLLRIDPVNLETHWLRNEYSFFSGMKQNKGRGAKLPTQRFEKAAHRYNELLVRQAFLDDRGKTIQRMLYYLGKIGIQRDSLAQIKITCDEIAETKKGLNTLLGIYGTAFRDGLSEGILDEQFDPAAQEFGDNLIRLQAKSEDAGKMCAAAVGKSFQPSSLSVMPGPEEAQVEWRNVRVERKGEPAALLSPYVPYGFHPYQYGSHHERSRKQVRHLLGLNNCINIPFILDDYRNRDPNKTFTWDLLDKYIDDAVFSVDGDAKFCVMSYFGIVHLTQHCPAWWLESNKNDPDIFFVDRNGTPARSSGKNPYSVRALVGSGLATGGYMAKLNLWNHKVQNMYREMLEQWSQRMSQKYPGRMLYFLVGWEGSNWGGVETGNNPSAVRQFRDYLEETYETVRALNEAWGTSYGDFSQIDPRSKVTSTPNGLLYEFERFRQKGYWDWMRLIRDSLKKYNPNLALANDFHNAGDLALYGGLNEPDMFEVYDIVGSHYFGVTSDKEPRLNRRLDSLRKVFGKTLGSFEWSTTIRTRDLFDENKFKAGGLLEIFEAMAWGKSVFAAWYDTHPGFDDGAEFWIAPFAHSVLRYSTTSLPLGRQMFRRFGKIAQENPTVTPKLMVLYPTSSFYNAVECRELTIKVVEALSEKAWDFGYLYEDVLAKGKQSLVGVETIVIPQGVCLEPKVSKVLLEWVGRGGTIIALMPPGIMNQYGKPDRTLCGSILGRTEFVCNRSFSEARPKEIDTKTTRVVESRTNAPFLLEAEYEKGKMFIYTDLGLTSNEDIQDLVLRTTSKDFWAKDGLFRIVARESNKHVYLFIVNTSLSEIVEETVCITGLWQNIYDLGCDVPFPVKSVDYDGVTEFQLKLTPGEGTVIQLEKSQ